MLALIASPARADDNVTISATPQYTKARAGDRFAVAVTFEFANHVHIWPNKPVIPDGVTDLNAIPTEIVVSKTHPLPTGFEAVLGAIHWPAPEIVEVNYGEPLRLSSYASRTSAFVPVAISPDAALGKQTLHFVVKYQACNESSCFPPESVTIEVPIEVVAATAAAVPGDAAAFKTLDPAFLATAFAGTVTPTGKVIDLGIFGWKLNVDGLVGYALLFLVALAGGFILNLTPCVLPVIPLKILSLQQQTGSRSKMLGHGFVMFLGIVALWLAVGVLIAYGVLGAISQISSYWQFNFVIAIVMFVMALGMFGLFAVGLPTWIYNIDAKHDSAKGSFVFGIMTAVLATPCVAPLAGGAAAAATQFPKPIALLIFVFLGVGMGVPYLLLAAFPRLVAWIPRAGPASELLKQVLGLLMIGVACFFLGTSLITLVVEKPWLSKQLHWWAIALTIALAMVWMIWQTWRITRSPVRRFVFTLLGVLLALAGFWWAADQTTTAEKQYARSVLVKSASGGLWADYDAAAVEKALAVGEVVVLDFTADWCLICKTLESSVLYTETVDKVLSQPGVKSFKVDLTSREAPGWDRLKAVGGAGVPYLVIQGPGLKEPWRRNGYTIGEVVAAVEQAKGKR